MTVKGSLIMLVKAGKPLLSPKFKAKKGAQTPERLEGGVRDVMEVSWAGGAYEPLGLNAKAFIDSGTLFEVSTTG